MNKFLIIIVLISLIVISCSISKHGVYYNEMANQPNIEIINNNKIVVNTDNSKINSALVISEIKYDLDTTKKEIRLKGFQALSNKYRNRFDIEINGLSKTKLDKYEFVWIDPDNKVTKIKYKNESIEQVAMTIDTFSTFPQEIQGCSCYFSNDSNDFKNLKYIYVNDFAQIAFLKINGVITKFTQTEFTNVGENNVIAKYKSDNFKMIVEIKDVKDSGYETTLQMGVIKLYDNFGNVLITSFYGECGC